MPRFMLKLDDGVHQIEIFKDYCNGYKGWFVIFNDCKSAFLRKEGGEWVQRIQDQLSVHDIKRITDAMHECALI